MRSNNLNLTSQSCADASQHLSNSTISRPMTALLKLIVLAALWVCLGCAASLDQAGGKRGAASRAARGEAGAGRLSERDLSPADDASADALGTRGGAAAGQGFSGQAKRAAWEYWSVGRDLDGAKLKSKALLDADVLLTRGKFSEAEAALNALVKDAKGSKILGASLSEAEQKAAVLRLVSARLSQKKGKEALSTLGRYLQDQKLKVEDIDLGLATFLGFTYAQNFDYEQSLAWLIRANELATGSPALEERVQRAASDVLVGIPQDSFEQSVGGWVDEGTFRGLVAQDRRRRTDLILSGRNPDEVAAQQVVAPVEATGLSKSAGGADYAEYQEQQGLGKGDSSQIKPAGVTSGEIAALLPLSGQFAAFGSAMKRGMELAMMDSQSKGITMRYIDVGSDVTGAASIVEGELATRPPLFLVGPLMSEQAASIAKIADQANVPLLHFSRREEADVGEEIFRFGLTVSGQVERLVKSAADLGIVRFAVVYPADPSGEESKSSFEKAVLRSGAAISYAASYNRGDQANFTELARQAEENGSQAVFFPDALKPAAQFFANFSSGTITPLGLVNWNQKNEMQRSAAIFNGAMYVAPFSLDSERQVVKDFVQAFQAKFNQKPDLLAAQGFDAVTITLSALKQSRGAEAEEIASAVRRLPVVAGITGDAHVEPNGEILREYEVIRFVDGEFKGQ